MPSRTQNRVSQAENGGEISRGVQTRLIDGVIGCYIIDYADVYIWFLSACKWCFGILPSKCSRRLLEWILDPLETMYAIEHAACTLRFVRAVDL